MFLPNLAYCSGYGEEQYPVATGPIGYTDPALVMSQPPNVKSKLQIQLLHC